MPTKSKSKVLRTIPKFTANKPVFPPTIKSGAALERMEVFGVDEILDMIMDGKSFCVIADQVGVAQSTLAFWLANTHFDSYENAKQIRWHRMASDLIEIADDSSQDKYIDENGNERTNAEVVARSRLRIDARKWLISKMLPKIYGDRIEVDAKVHSVYETVMRDVLEEKAKK